MKKQAIRLIAATLLAVMLLSALASCANGGNGENEQSETPDVSNVSQDSAADGEKVYKYLEEGVDLNKKQYVILNCLRDQWNMISYITADEITGTAINDEVYRRTVYVEETLNCRIKEYNLHESKLMSAFTTDVDSNVGELAMAYLQMGGNYEPLTDQVIEGRIASLDDISTVHLDEDYYVKTITDAASIAGKHYTTASNAQLNYYEGTWVLLFNHKMLDDEGIDMPYDLVRSGKWTFEAFHTMAKQVANQNGANSWTFESGGKAVYGSSFHFDGITAMMTAFGAKYGEKDQNDLPRLTCENSF